MRNGKKYLFKNYEGEWLGRMAKSLEQIKNKWSNFICDGKHKEADIKKK